MIPAAASLGIFVFILLLLLAMAPGIIAHCRDHRNKWLIYIGNIIFILIPFGGTVNVLGWIILLLFAFYRSAEVIVVQGPPGEKGEDGKDAVPLSKAGVATAKEKVDTIK